MMVVLASAITNNILLSNFLGMCSFLAISKQMKASLGLGTAVVAVMTITGVLNWLVYEYILVPKGLESFEFIVFIMIIAAFVQALEMFVERTSQSLYAALGIFLPLITVNCAVLGASLLMITMKQDFWTAVGYNFGSGVGWALAIILMAAIRERLSRTAKIPAALDGPGITLIIVGLMSLAFIGFSGMFSS
jgi:Na+-transporting NADH:ubiquinone oxidoreductase subunit E